MSEGTDMLELLTEENRDLKDRISSLEWELDMNSRPPKTRLLSRLAEIHTLFPDPNSADAAPLRLTLMSMLRYMDEEDVTRAVLEILPSLIIERE